MIFYQVGRITKVVKRNCSIFSMSFKYLSSDHMQNEQILHLDKKSYWGILNAYGSEFCQPGIRSLQSNLLALIATILQQDLWIQNNYPCLSVMYVTINTNIITKLKKNKNKNNKTPNPPQTIKPVDNIFPLHLLSL